MGASQSPPVAYRGGLSLLRLLREECIHFQGAPSANCWWTGFKDLGYQPGLGYGLVLKGPDGELAVIAWTWVDDFLLHGPSREKLSKALDYFLDTAVGVGMLCHPQKLVPPSQVVRYCGF